MTIEEISWETVLTNLHWEEKEIPVSPPVQRWMKAKAQRHGYDEVLVCLDGRHHYGVNHRGCDLSPGSAVLLPKEIPHDSWYGTHHAPCIDLWLHLFPHGKANLNFVQHHPKKKLLLFPVTLTDSALIAELQKACVLLNDPGMSTLGHRRKTDSFLLYLLHGVIEYLDHRKPTNESVNERLILDNIKRHASSHLTDRLSLDELAKIAGYSPFHFHRMFKRCEGRTPRAFVEMKRVERACLLLRKGWSMTATAMESGFSSSSQFSRTFKKHLNTSPSRWIEKVETENQG